MRTPVIYRLCDGISEVLLLFAVIFYPWAFGTTEKWSIGIMNGVGYGMGALLLIKWLVRWRTGYRPSRWACDLAGPPADLESEPAREASDPDHSMPQGQASDAGTWLVRALAWLTVFILVECLVSALNARVVYLETEGQRYLHYLGFIDWLPHSYDQTATGSAFCAYLGLGCFFWATRDIMIAKSALERHFERERAEGAVIPVSKLLPERIRRLLWVICLNGAGLGLVSILQRLDGTDKLLWLMERQGGFPPDFSFGPYAYRGNAAQYFNLLWPVCLGFWWIYRAQHLSDDPQSLRYGSGPHVMLLPAAVMAICPIFSGHAAGAWLSLVSLPIAFAVLLRWGQRRRVLSYWMLLVAAMLGVGGYLGWKPIARDLPQPSGIEGGVAVVQRPLQNATTLTIIREHPVFGVGPYAYRFVYEFYRSANQPVFSFAHNDWLQTLTEWGWSGFVLIVMALAILVVYPLITRTGHLVFVGTLLTGITVLLVHAVFDFPLQIQSILFSAVLLLAMMVSLPTRVLAWD